MMCEVSVIVPVRNEEAHIEQCLRSILENDFPKEKYEVFVIDGMSEDTTREKVKQFKSIIMLDNPKKIVPTGLNKAIKRAKGKYVVRIDGHCYVEKSFLRKNVALLEKHPECGCVGGRIYSINKSSLGKSIAAAMSSRFGVGGAKFRYAEKAGYVDTLAFGMYRKNVFSEVGYFDETLVRNQDDEFNLRLGKQGKKIFFDPEIKSFYYPRSSLRGLWKQYFQYGFWKVSVLQKHKTLPSVRMLIPPAFVVSLFLFCFLGFLISFIPLLAVLVVYGISSAAASVLVGIKKRVNMLHLPLIYFCLHSAYGLGFLRGIGRFLL